MQEKELPNIIFIADKCCIVGRNKNADGIYSPEKPFQNNKARMKHFGSP